MSENYYLFYREDSELFLEIGDRDYIYDFMDEHFDGQKIRFCDAQDGIEDLEEERYRDVILIRGQIIEGWDILDDEGD